MIPPAEGKPAGRCDADATCLHVPCFQVQLDAARPRRAHREANACAYHVPDIIETLRVWAGEHGLAGGQLTVLASERNTRVLDAEPRIPWLLWCGLIFGGVLLVGLTGYMRLDSTRVHVILCGAVAVLLGLLLFVVYCLDHPFGGQVGITPAPFQHSLEVFDAVDSGT